MSIMITLAVCVWIGSCFAENTNVLTFNIFQIYDGKVERYDEMCLFLSNNAKEIIFIEQTYFKQRKFWYLKSIFLSNTPGRLIVCDTQYFVYSSKFSVRPVVRINIIRSYRNSKCTTKQRNQTN